jgi:osmotically-inducible protein OsmY
MRKRLNAILAVLAFAVLITACTQQADIGITTKVKSLLDSDRAISNAAQIQVTTEKKVVTLAGPVDSSATKAHAVTLAKGVEGVKKVVDNLTVAPASVAAAQPAAVVAAPDTTTAPTDTVSTQAAKPTTDTATPQAAKPTTDSATKQAAKPTTDKAIPQADKPTTDPATLETTKPTTDTPTTQAVKPTDTATTQAVRSTDTAITQAVKEKLLLRPEAASEIIGVVTHEGVVTLSGTVKSPEVKEQVIQIARGTEGVQRVEDKLSVSSS